MNEDAAQGADVNGLDKVTREKLSRLGAAREADVNGLEDMNREQLSRLRAAAIGAARDAGAGDEAEDIAASVFLKLAIYGKPVDDLGAFVRKVARNEAIDRHRRTQNLPERGSFPLSDPRGGGPGYPVQHQVPSPSLQPRQRAALVQLLSLLTPSEQALILGQAQGRTIEQLAEMHDYTPQSVRTKLSAARKKLRARVPDFRNFLDGDAGLQPPDADVSTPW